MPSDRVAMVNNMHCAQLRSPARRRLLVKFSEKHRRPDALSATVLCNFDFLDLRPVVLFLAHEEKVVGFVWHRGCICCDIMVMCGISVEFF